MAAIRCLFCSGDHGGTITPDVSLDCAVVAVAELRALLRDTREWVERCRSVLHDLGQHEDAVAAQVTLDSIDAELRDA